jgi:hypothetical protein
VFDKIRRLYDKDHRSAWEDALSALDIFRGSRLRLIATTPEKVIETPVFGRQTEVEAQVLFSDEQDVPRVVIDFYESNESNESNVVSISYLVGEQVVAGGFNRVRSVEDYIASWAEASAVYLATQVKKMEGKLGRRLG